MSLLVKAHTLTEETESEVLLLTYSCQSLRITCALQIKHQP